MVCGAEKPGVSPSSWETQAFVAVPGRTTLWQVFFPSVSYFSPGRVNQLWAALLSLSMGQRDAGAQILQISHFWVNGAVGGLREVLCPAASVLESIGKMLGEDLIRILTCPSR